MEIMVDGKSIKLLGKNRVVGSETPAIKLSMTNGEEKIIGMMVTKVQVIISLPDYSELSESLVEVLEKFKDKIFFYFITSDKSVEEKKADNVSTDFLNYAKKFGLSIEDEIIAKSIFIIDKEGDLFYKDIPIDLGYEFNEKVFEEELTKIVNYKKRGHTHENWMRV